MESKKQTAVEWLIQKLDNNLDISHSWRTKQYIEQAIKMEKERENHFVEVLKGSTQFLEKVISEGSVDNSLLLKMFIEGQIANNKITLETYGK